MRIAFDHQAFCRQSYGGVSRYFHHLVNQIAVQGLHEVRVFAPFHINKYFQGGSSQIISGKYLSHYPLQLKPLFQFFNGRLAGQRIGQWKPDIIHETYFSSRPVGPVSVPRVVTVYDMIHERYPSHFWPWDRTRANKRRAIERADHVICISESTRNDLIHFLDFPPDKASVVHLAYEKFEAQEPLDAHMRLVPARPFILFVGNRQVYKNFRGFLLAYAASARLSGTFNVVCFGGGSFSKEELARIERFKLSGKVVQVSGGDQLLGSLYRRASAFAYPSLYEGFGLPPLEAMAHDCPVVCSNTSSIPEVVGDAGEFFDPSDTDSMREALERVLFTDELRVELIRRGRQRLSHFSWGKCAAETLEIYKNVRDN